MSSASADLSKLQKEGKDKQDIADLYAKNRAGGSAERSAEGDALMAKANKKLDKWFGGSKKYDRAAELFEQAAAAYKMNDNWEEASNALVKVAEIQEKHLKDALEAAHKYTDAGMCLARVDIDGAMRLLEMAIQIHTAESRLGAAARVWKELAQLLEDEEKNQQAIEAWRKAADCHEAEGTMANCIQILLRMAELHVREYQFKKASKLYERCAEIAVDKNINKGAIRDYQYNALLCQFVVSARKGNLKNMHSLFSRLLDTDRQFTGTWQERLLRKCMSAFEAGDVQAFTQAVYDQDQIHKLDELSTKILLEVKNILKNPPESGPNAEEVAESLV